MFNADMLSAMISHAVAPAFLLSCVVALVSILTNRMAGLTERIRNLNQIADNDEQRAWLKTDTRRLTAREGLLKQALYLSVIAGISITALLLVGFIFAFLGYKHEPSAGVLFIVSLLLIVASLGRFLARHPNIDQRTRPSSLTLCDPPIDLLASRRG